jgi:hypothetical protein
MSLFGRAHGAILQERSTKGQSLDCLGVLLILSLLGPLALLLFLLLFFVLLFLLSQHLGLDALLNVLRDVIELLLKVVSPTDELARVSIPQIGCSTIAAIQTYIQELARLVGHMILIAFLVDRVLILVGGCKQTVLLFEHVTASLRLLHFREILIIIDQPGWMLFPIVIIQVSPRVPTAPIEGSGLPLPLEDPISLYHGPEEFVFD